MSSVVIAGNTSGSVTLEAPAVAGTTVLTLPTTNGTIVTTATSTGISGSAITTGTVGVSVGGTGANSATAYAVQCGGTTSTGAFQSVASVGTSGQVLTSNGAGALPTFQTLSGTPAGAIIQFAGTAAPTGYLLCPTSLTNISRTTYATLFAAIGTTWGAGDGTTTFGLPWFTADFAPVQASANVGTSTTGSVIAHTHSTGSGANGTPYVTTTGTYNPSANLAASTTGSTGGTNNLAAGARVLFCIKY
jgi:microcystin-dependent protein